jgi:hypothetical protein
MNGTATLRFEYDCPLGPNPYPDDPPDFLPHWMGSFRAAGLLEHVTLVDLCLPGTHDSLSYDLSLTVSESGIDNLRELADVLHKLSGGHLKLIPGDLEDFFRIQAKTQELTLPQQLDNGVRFIDFRLMLEPDRNDWYSIHFMQSNQVVETYWKQVRGWMDAHPDEIVVLWLSREGNPGAEGQDQYPGVSKEEKGVIWRKFLRVFDGLLLDTREASIFVDSVETLIAKDFRLIAFATDYVEFTDSSPFAINAASIQNRYDSGDGVFNAEASLEAHRYYFQNAVTNNAAEHARSGFTLLGMNTQGQAWQILASAEKRFLGWGDDLFSSCSSHFDMPEAPHWCPETLLDIAQLTSYYNQAAFEYAVENLGESTGFPNAFYLDALDLSGTVRTGPQLLDGANRGGDIATNDAKYPYVDTVLIYNVKNACQQLNNSQSCTNFAGMIDRRREKFAMMLWDDPSRARHSEWPEHTRNGGDTISPRLLDDPGQMPVL